MQKLWSVVAWVLALLLLTGALVAVYGWWLGLPFGAALVVASVLVQRGIIR